MEKIIKQTVIEYQMSSLIDFLLGDGTRAGWLDEYCPVRHSFGHANGDVEQNDPESALMEDGDGLSVKDGRHERAEGSAEYKSDGVAGSNAQITDGQAEGETADPHRAPQIAACQSVALGPACRTLERRGTRRSARTSGATIHAAKP